MKEQITKRKMFAKPMSKASKNSGIMAGFEDMEPEEDEMPPMARNPQNPEILMNNLRGDFRSVDARYAELAQMVGEEAASETPPEVLAMLQPQLAAPAAPPQPPQGGIGALPQGAGMAPPPEMMGSMAPPMPQGMEGAPPFPQGGADNAPPTPDGLPPEYLAGGGVPGLIGRGARYAYDLGAAGVGKVADEASLIGGYLGNKFKPYLTQADEAFGRMLAPYTRTTDRLGVDNKPIVAPANQSITSGPGRNPTGVGEGTKGVRATDIEFDQFPLSDRFRESVARDPRAAQAALGTAGGTAAYFGVNAVRDSMPRGAADPNFVSQVDQIDQTQLPRDPRTGGQILPTPSDTWMQIELNRARGIPSGTTPSAPPVEQKAEAASIIPVTPGKKDTNAFIADQIKKAEGPTKTRAQRITEEFRAIEPTFRELLGDTKSDMRTNALLLLADAGFKFASERKPTMAMALASALSGMPKGLAVLTAQARDMNIKIKSAALEQAANNINMQDKLGRDLQVEMLKSQNRRAEEILKSDLKIREIGVEGRTPIEEDAGVGGISVKNKRGDYLGFYLKRDKDGKLPSEIQTVIDSPYTLRPTSPYVTDLGESRTPPVTDKATRLKIREELMGYDDALSSITQMKTAYANSASKYGPKGWYSNVENNLLVPILPIEPNIADEKARTTINAGINQLQSRLARLGGYGSQVAVQEQKWIRELLPNQVGSLFADVEVNLAKINALETMLLNERQQRVNRLTGLSREYVMNTPAMGTQKDPFIMPGDPEGQASMESFLRSTIGTVQDPRATIYVRLPNGTVQATTSAGLRGQ